jgi:hypothetical protein
MTQIDFHQVFEDYIADTQKVWEHDRSKTVGASEIFGCLRQIFFKKRGEELGYEQDPNYEFQWGAARRGDLIEEHHVVPAMKYLPDPIEPWIMGSDQVTLIKGKNSATPDGLLVNCARDALKLYGVDDIESTRITLEIKSIDPRVNLKEEKQIHRGQTITQLGMIREETENEEDKPVYGVILYIDASFLNDIDVFIVKYDPNVWKAAQVRAKSIWKSNDPRDFAPEGKLDGACDNCMFKRECMTVILGQIPEDTKDNATDEVVEEMEKLISHYKKIKQEKEDAEKEFDATKQKVKDMLVDKKRRRVKGEWWSTSYTSVKGRKSLNKKAMKDDGIDLSLYEEEGVGYDKLTITIKEEKK